MSEQEENPLDRPAPDEAEKASAELESLYAVIARLRAPGGCPWDREQTPESLWPYLREETYEVLDAIRTSDDASLREELGDVLLQVMLHSVIARERGAFTLADVALSLREKMVRRHPHVFGDETVSGSADVLANWEAIKAKEKGDAYTSVLDGVPDSLPALTLAASIEERMRRTSGREARDTGDLHSRIVSAFDGVPDARKLGEALYAIVELALASGIDAEEALRTVAVGKKRGYATGGS